MSDLEQPEQKPSSEATNPRLIEPSKVEPMSEATSPTLGTKLFVIFFMLIVPPIGIAIVAGVCWTVWKIIVNSQS